jgi:hypothetical protein
MSSMSIPNVHPPIHCDDKRLSDIDIEIIKSQLRTRKKITLYAEINSREVPDLEFNLVNKLIVDE